MQANHLKVLEDGIILKSEACLVSSRRSADPTAVAALAQRIQAAIARG
ncbi:hypothetical protein LJD42_28715 [Escherichia coli]|nr:hypothetical protein [Escherichia coli]